MDDLGWAYRWGVPILVATLVASLMVDCAQGQSFKADGEGGVMAWASDSRSYQHTMRAGAWMTVRWGPVVVRPKLSITRWGAPDAKIPSAILNAETARVYSRRQGIGVGYRHDWIEVGVELDRRSVHHVWRNGGRATPASIKHNYFPGTWQVGRKGCQGIHVSDWPESACPSLGYWSGGRPYLRLTPDRGTVMVRGPLVTWKTLTLPWPALRLHATYEWQSWQASVDLQGLRHRSWTGSLRLARHLAGPLWTQAKAGWAHPPQWR